MTTLLQMGRWTMIKLPKTLCNIKTHRSPTSILVLHKFSFIANIRGYIPTRPSHYELHKEWVISAQQKEPHISQRNIKLCECYNTTSHELQELPVGTSVVIQNQGGRYSRKWDRTDWLVEVLPNCHYRERMDGSGRITLRNRRFPREYSKLETSTIIPSAIQPESSAKHSH